MRLMEHEGKKLLNQAGLAIPVGFLVSKKDLLDPDFNLNTQLSNHKINWPVFVKAQVLMGNRGLANLVKSAQNEVELQSVINEFMAKTTPSGEEVNLVLVEEAIEFEQMHYLSLSYDTRYRRLVVAWSQAAGSGMDERGDQVTVHPLSINEAPPVFEPNPELQPIIAKLHQVFIENDLVLAEINPLAKTKQGWVCLDAKLELEDRAEFRHPQWRNYSKRSDLGRLPTQREELAHEISRSDHRGAAGESFFEFTHQPNEVVVGVLAAGGGASILAMDSLLAEGIKPANYTEHSGNPPREKVARLTEVILSIPKLKGLFVVGSNANFTDIYETLNGVVDALEKSPYGAGFCVLIRRGGPRWQEAFDSIGPRLAKKGYIFKLFGPDFPISSTAAEMSKLLKEAHATTK